MNDRARRIIPLIVIAALLYVGFVTVMTELTVYGITTTARSACREYMAIVASSQLSGAPVGDRWQKKFMRGMRARGVKLKDGDWQFEIVGDTCHRKRGCKCGYSIIYDVKSEWPFLSDFFDGLPPYRRVGEKSEVVDFLTSY